MFLDSAFNGNISYWDVENVENMEAMFKCCTMFTGDLSRWNVYNVIKYNEIFSSCPIIEEYKPKKFRKI